MLKRLLRHPGVHALLAALVGRYLSIALGTTRWRVEGAEYLAPQLRGAGAIAAFWHERLPLMPALWRVVHDGGAGAPGYVLVSRHSDGRFIAALLRRFGVGVVHGSTARNGQDRGGASGMRRMLERLQEGAIVVLTPDGPRGPRRVAALGVAQLAALSGVPVLPCSAQMRPRITLGSWDRMVLPLPFGRGVLVCLAPIPVARDDAELALPAIAAALSEAAEAADLACRR